MRNHETFADAQRRYRDEEDRRISHAEYEYRMGNDGPERRLTAPTVGPWYPVAITEEDCRKAMEKQER